MPNEQTEVVLHTAGVSRGNPGPAGAAAILLRPPDHAYQKIYCHLQYRTNNAAEYQALLMGLKRSLQHGFRRVIVRSSSELMVNQLKGSYTVKSLALQPLHAEAVALLAHFDHWQADHVPRRENREPYRLAKKAIDEHEQRAVAPGRLAP